MDHAADAHLESESHEPETLRALPSVDTPNPATSGHLKTGHHRAVRDVFILGLTCC